MHTCSSCSGFVPSEAQSCPHCDTAVPKKSWLKRSRLGKVVAAGAASVTLMACYGMAPVKIDCKTFGSRCIDLCEPTPSGFTYLQPTDPTTSTTGFVCEGRATTVCLSKEAYPVECPAIQDAGPGDAGKSDGGSQSDGGLPTDAGTTDGGADAGP